MVDPTPEWCPREPPRPFYPLLLSLSLSLARLQASRHSAAAMVGDVFPQRHT
jgi:hypothetical protein